MEDWKTEDDMGLILAMAIPNKLVEITSLFTYYRQGGFHLDDDIGAWFSKFFEISDL